VVLAAVGCNAIYGLEPTRLPDALIDADCTQVTPDEDGDCVANADDNCPGRANREQVDGDADGVGDVCDPYPITTGDRIVTFQSFDDPPSAQQQWHDVEVQSGQWVFEPGQVRHDDVADAFSVLQITEPISLDTFAIEIGLRVDALPATNLTRYYGILLDHPTADISTGHQCAVKRDATFPVGTAQVALLEATAGGGSRQFVDDPPPGSSVMIQLTRVANTEIRCVVRLNDEVIDLGRVLPIPNVAWPRTGYFSANVNKSSVTLLWATLYAR
jgi:hypothetical protein